MEEYHTPELPLAILILVFFLAGIIVAYLFNISARFKARRTIKKQNITLASHNAEVAVMRREIDSLKGIETPEDGKATDATQKFSYDSLADNQTENPDEETDEKK
jgi:hypothetical protein